MLKKSNCFLFWAVAGISILMLTAVAFAADIKYDAGGRRDPFVPIQDDGGGGVHSSGLVLEGIIYDPPSNSVALIGGQPYKVGDALEEGKVLGIQNDHVLVEVSNEKKTLWLHEGDQELLGKEGRQVS